MNKILLVYEDYTDLMNTESSLKKIGFDVVGVTNEYSLSEQVISFNPDVVVGYGKGGKVTPASIGKKLKEMPRWPGKVILIFSANAKPSAQDLIKIRADMLLEAPVPALRLIQVLAKLLGHDEAVLLERLNKIMHNEAPTNSATTMVPGGPVKTAANERIYVGGSVGGGAGGDSKVAGGGSAAGEAKQMIGGAPESEAPEEPRSSSLFGNLKHAKDLYHDTDSTPDPAGDSVNLFPDVNLQDLERELNAPPGGAPAKGKEVSFKLGDRPDDNVDPELQLTMAAELAEASKNVSKKIAKYSQMTQEIHLPPTSTVRRVEARKRQRELVKDWDQKNIKEIDELRREFTKAMFKK